MSSTPAWISTDGIQHFGIWKENFPCKCSSTHKLKKQYKTMTDPELNTNPPDLGVTIAEEIQASESIGG